MAVKEYTAVASSSEAGRPNIPAFARCTPSVAGIAHMVLEELNKQQMAASAVVAESFGAVAEQSVAAVAEQFVAAVQAAEVPHLCLNSAV